jgi:hypothetical protein
MKYDSHSTGVTYSDTFYFKNHYCLTACGRNQSRILIHSQFNYKQKVNILIRGNIKLI